MHVIFRTAALQQAYTAQKKAVKLWGQSVARKYIQRVDVLYAAMSADDLLKTPPLRFHPLKGEKEGYFSLTVHDRFRLIVSFEDEAMTRVVVEEVSNHYGD